MATGKLGDVRKNNSGGSTFALGKRVARVSASSVLDAT